MYPQLGDHALEKIAKDYMDVEGDESEEEDMPMNMKQYEAEAEEDDPVQQMDEAAEDATENLDIEILDGPPAVFQTPRRKKTLKVKES